METRRIRENRRVGIFPVSFLSTGHSRDGTGHQVRATFEQGGPFLVRTLQLFEKETDSPPLLFLLTIKERVIGMKNYKSMALLFSPPPPYLYVI